jgi:hypothetical protein
MVPEQPELNFDAADEEDEGHIEYQKLIDSMPYGLHVMESGAGFYLGTCFFEKVDPKEHGNEGVDEKWYGYWQPNSRETLYYPTEEEATFALNLLLVEGIFNPAHINDGMQSQDLIYQIKQDKALKDSADEEDKEEWRRRQDPEYVKQRTRELGPKHIFAAEQVKKALESLNERDEFRESMGQPEASIEETIKEVDGTYTLKKTQQALLDEYYTKRGWDEGVPF